VLCTHYNTLEFTKDAELSRNGDCIIGVRADFDPGELAKFAKKYSRAKLIIRVGGLSEEITIILNKGFDDTHEIVLRKSEYPSKRTLGIRADKSAQDIDRRIVEKLRDPLTKADVEVIGE
jgi:hypothetical protein